MIFYEKLEDCVPLLKEIISNKSYNNYEEDLYIDDSQNNNSRINSKLTMENNNLKEGKFDNRVLALNNIWKESQEFI